MMKRISIGLALCISTLGCGGETASLTVSLSGEEAAAEGFEADAFADGWSVRFDALVVSIRSLELRSQDGDDALLDADPVIVDLHRGDALGWTFEGVGARRWDDVSYRIGPALEESRVVGTVDLAIRQRMIDEGLSIYVEGEGTKGDISRRFEWAFTIDVLSARCEGADGTDGIIVASGAQNEMQITTHWDHLFFDSLAIEQASMRFDALAAASEGVVTLEALSTQRLTDLRGLDGEPLVDENGAPIIYDPGSTPLSELTLRGMLEAVAATVGHLDGEGHCDYQRL